MHAVERRAVALQTLFNVLRQAYKGSSIHSLPDDGGRRFILITYGHSGALWKRSVSVTVTDAMLNALAARTPMDIDSATEYCRERRIFEYLDERDDVEI